MQLSLNTLKRLLEITKVNEVHACSNFLQNGVACACNPLDPSAQLKSPLDYLLYFIQFKWCANSCYTELGGEWWRELYVCLVQMPVAIFSIIDSWLVEPVDVECKDAGSWLCLFLQRTCSFTQERWEENGRRTKEGCSFSFHCKMLSALWVPALVTPWNSTVRISISYFKPPLSQKLRFKTDWETYLNNLSAFPPCCQIENFWLSRLELGEAKAFTTLFF